MIEEMDKNHDGKVSKAEFEAHFVGALDKILSPDQKMVEIMIAEREAQYSYAPLLGDDVETPLLGERDGDVRERFQQFVNDFNNS